MPAVTPAPEKTPPEGVAPLNVNAASAAHTVPDAIERVAFSSFVIYVSCELPDQIFQSSLNIRNNILKRDPAS